LVHRSVELLEPGAHAFEASLFALVSALCIDARMDPISPHYLFAFPKASRVETVRRRVNEEGLGAWRDAEPHITVPTGNAVLVGRVETQQSLVRCVVVCSGPFPDLHALRIFAASARTIFVADPAESIQHETLLRRFASLGWTYPTRRDPL
jgi:hypothetical protein